LASKTMRKAKLDERAPEENREHGESAEQLELF
jgi:hypothetical protein